MDRLDPAPSGSRQGTYRFGEFRLEADGVLLRGETPIPLEADELAALRLLLAHPGHLVPTHQFKQALWGEESVAADAVADCLESLRRRLEPESCIESIPRRGYRFSAKVQIEDAHALPSIARLVVAPFAAGYGVPEYLSTALAEDAAHRLAGAQPAVAVLLPTDSVSTLARRGLAPRQIGERMQADLVLSGELHAMASHYRLRAELIHVESGSQLWAEDVLIERARMADLARDLANRTILRLSGLLPPGSGLSLAAAAETSAPEPTPDQREAYELYARGRHEWQSLERHRMQDAMQHLERAVELDPDLIEARAGLVNLYMSQSGCGFLPALTAAEKAHAIAGPVEHLPPRGEMLLPALGWALFHVDRDLPAALRAFARSAHLPHDPWITRARVMFALSRRRFGEAIEIEHAAIRIDPYSPWLQSRLAWAYHLAGEFELSVQTARAALQEFPGQNGPELYGAIILAFNGEAPQAVEVAEALEQRVPYFDPATSVCAYALAMAGRASEARAALERLQWLRRERFAMSTFSAAAHGALGDLDAALAELRTADSLRCPWFFQMLADPRLLALRDNPEFASMRGILPGMEAQAARDAREE